MVDKTPTPRSSRERIKTLAQAALNADVTVDQLDTLLTGMSDTLTDLNKTMSGMEGTLEYFEQTLQVFNADAEPHRRTGAAAQCGGRPAWRASSSASSASSGSARW